MWIRVGIWLSILAGVSLLAAAGWVLLRPSFTNDALPLRDVLAAEQSARWAVLGVLGALLGNVLLFLNLRIAAQATDAAKVAADAALEAVKHAQKTSALELRPYVENTSTNYSRDVQDGKKIVSTSLRLTWRNTGRTPARNIRTFTGWASGPAGKDWSTFDFPERREWVSDGGQIGVESEIYTYTHFKIPVEELSQVFAGTRSVIFYGSIEYDGVIAGERHRTEVSGLVVVPSDPTDLECQYSHRFLGRHHGYDEDCTYRPRRRAADTRVKGFAPQPGASAAKAI